MKNIIHITLYLCLLYTSCGTYSNYNSFEDETGSIVKDTISNLLQNEFNDNYIPYNFSKLTIKKPTEFIKLDSLYFVRKKIVKNKRKNKSNYDNLLDSINKKIDLHKDNINAKKIYHTYIMEHIYIVKKLNSYVLYHKNFILFPNYTIKNTTIELATILSKENKQLFDYFNNQEPLFNTQDINYNNKMNQLVYDRFNNALANEYNHKEQLLHTILYCVDYILKHNSFDEQAIAEEMAEKWLESNKLLDFIPKFKPLSPIYKNKEIVNYSLVTTNSEKTFNFTLDLNLVITNTSIR